MGWLNEFEQRHVAALYGVHARFRCNDCGRLIWIHELEIVDPKGGYRKLATNATYGNRYSRPKITYCRDCDAKRRGKVLVDTFSDIKDTTLTQDIVTAKILEMIRSNPHTAWTRRMLVKSWPGQIDRKLIRVAVMELKKRHKVTVKRKVVALIQKRKKGAKKHKNSP